MLRIALHRPQNGRTVVILVVQDNLVKGFWSSRAMYELDVWTR